MKRYRDMNRHEETWGDMKRHERTWREMGYINRKKTYENS